MHRCMFITENYCLKFTIMSFRASAPKSPTKNGIPKNIWIRLYYRRIFQNVTNIFLLGIFERRSCWLYKIKFIFNVEDFL